MNTIAKTFKKRPAFIGFVTGGDGGIEYTVECCLKLIEGGVDILEIGFPFSDPIADGAVIQQSSKRSLKAGTTSSTILKIGKEIRKRADTPLILFTYCNPILKRGEIYLKELKDSGFSAILTVDLPLPISMHRLHQIDESKNLCADVYYENLRLAGLQPILIASPSTEVKRLEQIKAKSEGFIYYACQKGTTGVRKNLPEDFTKKIKELKKEITIPVAVGFGISNKEMAEEVLRHADGFVVGSAFVKLMEHSVPPDELKKFAKSIDPREKV